VSFPALTMFLGQSEMSNPIDISIHLSQETSYMMWSCLRLSSMLESESEWS
jgi:hypothetical protein